MMKAIFSILLFLSSCWGVKVFDTVVTNGDGPLPIATFDSAAISETSFVFFGGAVNGTFSNKTFILSRISKSSAVWSQILPQTVPSARWFPGMATVRDDDGNVYACMYGGSTFIPPITFTVSSDFFLCFNGSSLQWIDLSSIPGAPGPRSGVSMSGRGANAYVFGGINPFFQTQSDLFRFNINTMQWTNLTVPGNDYSANGKLDMYLYIGGPNPPPRQIGNMVILCDFHNCKLVLTSGEKVFFNPGLATSQINDTWEFNLNSQTWANVTDEDNMVIPPRNNHECFTATNNQLRGIIFGGDMPGTLPGCTDTENPTNEIWKYNVLNKKWNQVNTEDAPLGIKRHTCARFEDTQDIWAIGGYHKECVSGVDVTTYSTAIISISNP